MSIPLTGDIPMTEKYEKELLNLLKKKYDRRFQKDSSFQKGIFINFTDKEYKKYVAENAYEYKEDIDSAVKKLVSLDFITVKYNKITHDIERIKLNNERISEINAYLGQDYIKDVYENAFNVFEKLPYRESEIFCGILKQKYGEGKSIEAYVKNSEEYRDAIKTVSEIKQLKEEVLIRNLSIKLFGDSKRVERIKNRITEVYNLVNSTEYSENEVFSLLGITKNPTYIFLKGNAVININGQSFDLQEIGSGIAVCSDIAEKIAIEKICDKTITTIENLTTYNDYNSSGLVVFTNGFACKNIIKFLNNIKKNDIAFYHFGDIDFGGFSILKHLIENIGRNIVALHMDIKTLKQYERSCKTPMDAYIEKLKKLLLCPQLAPNYETIEYMIEHKVILEQEALFS